MGAKPVIGVSVGYHDFGDYQGGGFQRPIAIAGGVPLTLSRVEGTLDDVLDVADVHQLGDDRHAELFLGLAEDAQTLDAETLDSAVRAVLTDSTTSQVAGSTPDGETTARKGGEAR